MEEIIIFFKEFLSSSQKTASDHSISKIYITSTILITDQNEATLSDQTVINVELDGNDLRPVTLVFGVLESEYVVFRMGNYELMESSPLTRSKDIGEIKKWFTNLNNYNLVTGDYILRTARSTATGIINTHLELISPGVKIDFELSTNTSLAAAGSVDFENDFYKIYFNPNSLLVIYKFIVATISNDKIFPANGKANGAMRLSSVKLRNPEIIDLEMQQTKDFFLDNTKFWLVNHLFNSVIMLITLHEFAHISRGHLKLLYFAIPKKLYKQYDEGYPSDGTLLKTLEYDADRYAIIQMYAFYSSVYMDTEMIPGIYCDEEFHKKVALFCFYFTHSIFSLLLVDTDYFKYKNKHPTSQMRMLAAIGDLVGFWAKQGKDEEDAFREYEIKFKESIPFINEVIDNIKLSFHETFEELNSTDDINNLEGTIEERYTVHSKLMFEYGLNWNKLYLKMQEYAYTELIPLKTKK